MATLEKSRPLACPCCGELMDCYTGKAQFLGKQATYLSALARHGDERQVQFAIVPFADDQVPEFWIAVLAFIDAGQEHFRYRVTDAAECLWSRYAGLSAVRGLTRDEAESGDVTKPAALTAASVVMTQKVFARFLTLG